MGSEADRRFDEYDMIAKHSAGVRERPERPPIVMAAADNFREPSLQTSLLNSSCPRSLWTRYLASVTPRLDASRISPPDFLARKRVHPFVLRANNYSLGAGGAD